MRRLCPSVLALCVALGAMRPARDAWAGPDAAQVRKAAEEFDEGTRAFKAEEFEEAASRFEAADDAVPSPDALRLAIRSRVEAGQMDRAATLSALALARYAPDHKTAEYAQATLDAFASDLFELKVSCASPCVLAVGTRSIHGAARTRWTVFLDPGEHVVSASFFGGVSGGEESVTASAGGESSVRFEPEESSGHGAVGPAAAPRQTDETPADAPPPEEPDEADGGGGGLHPAFFVVGLIATAGLTGVTIWSGVDTQKNPGADAVREACAGQGTECPEYQDGLSRQTRTNVLIGVTAGTAALTLLVGAVLTDWGGGSPDEDGDAARDDDLSVHVSASPSSVGMVAGGRF